MSTHIYYKVRLGFCNKGGCICSNQNLDHGRERSFVRSFRVYTKFRNECTGMVDSGEWEEARKRSLTFVCTFVRHLAGTLTPVAQIPANWNISRSLMFPVNNKPVADLTLFVVIPMETTSFFTCFLREFVKFPSQDTEIAYM